MRPSPIATDAFQIVKEDGAVAYAQVLFSAWCDWNDHPRHQKNARSTHAQQELFAQKATGSLQQQRYQVVGAEWEGRWYKVDGHRRTVLWQTGQLPPPESLQVTLYRVQSLEALNKLYRVFHAPSATDTSYAIIVAAFREQKLQLNSMRLRKGYIADALNIALRGATRAHQSPAQPPLDLAQAVAVFRDELLTLDQINPPREVYQSGVVAAALVGLALYPQAQAFFSKLARKEGAKQQGRLDPIEATLVQIDHIKHDKTSRAKVLQADLCARTLRALRAWLDYSESDPQYWFKNKMRAVDMTDYIIELKNKKEILHNPAL